MSLSKDGIPDDIYFEMFKNMFQIDVDISDDEWEVIKRNVKIARVPKNTIVLKPGEIETVARFIIDGVAKATHHGEEIYVDEFMTDFDFLNDSFSVFDEVPSMYSFQTITDCIWIEVSNLKKLTDENCKVQKVFLRNLNRFLKKFMDYNKKIRKQTAKERYIQYCETHPKVIKYAKVSDIASYFGITIQSLSRIRKEIVSDGF